MHIGMLIQECPKYKCKILCSKEEKEKRMVMYWGVAFSSHNGNLTFILSLLEIFFDDTLWSITQQPSVLQM